MFLIPLCPYIVEFGSIVLCFASIFKSLVLECEPVELSAVEQDFGVKNKDFCC